MSAEELDKHTDAFKLAYERFPALSEKQRVAWAERIAGNPLLQAIYSTTGPVLTGKFFPSDYTEDGKRPVRLGGGAR